MCVIAIKPRDIAPPSKEIIEECFRCNKDGAGFMYKRPSENCVRIEKGFMSIEALLTRLKELNFTEKDVVVYHFRIATSGAKDGTATHPFPLSRQTKHLKKLQFITEVGMAHNGILNFNRHDTTLSDTQEFIKEYLATLEIREGILKHDIKICNKLNLFTGISKIVLLLNTGEIIKWGEWIEDNGLSYSNNSYKIVVTTNYHEREWDWSTHDWHNKSQHKPTCWIWDVGKKYWWRWNYGYKEFYAGVLNPNVTTPGYTDIEWSEYAINEKLREKEDKITIDIKSGEVVEPEVIFDEIDEDNILKGILKDFIDEFFIFFSGDDTKWNTQKAIDKAFEETEISSKLIVTPDYLEELAEIELTEEAKNKASKENVVNAIALFDNEKQKNLDKNKKE